MYAKSMPHVWALTARYTGHARTRDGEPKTFVHRGATPIASACRPELSQYICLSTAHSSPGGAKGYGYSLPGNRQQHYNKEHDGFSARQLRYLQSSGGLASGGPASTSRPQPRSAARPAEHVTGDQMHRQASTGTSMTSTHGNKSATGEHLTQSGNW